MIDTIFAQQFAEEWLRAWNAHNLEVILAHYTDDFEMSSPFIVERMQEPSGTPSHGKDARVAVMRCCISCTVGGSSSNEIAVSVTIGA